MTSHKIFLGLGANVGDKKANLLKAIELLKEKVSDIVPDFCHLTKSPFFRHKLL